MSEDRSIISLGGKGIQLTNFEELYRFSTFVAKSSFAPKGIDTPEKVFLAVQMGMELGLSPMMALQNCAVINGRPGFFGELVEAIIQSHPDYEDCQIWYEGTGDELACHVTLKRKGRNPRTGSFSIQEAKAAKLLDKADTWGKYTRRMLYWRAFGFAKGLFSDVLKGFKTAEELGDVPVEAEAKVLPMKRAEIKKHENSKINQTVTTDNPATDIPPPVPKANDPSEAVPKKEESQAVPAASGDMVNPKLDDLTNRMEKARVTASEVIGALMSHSIDCGLASESGEPGDLPSATLEMCIKQWPTVIFTIERHRKAMSQEKE